MGGMGSGRHWHYNAKDTTDDYRAIDVRHWARKGLLVTGRIFSWQWSRHNEVMASIQVRVETGRVRLIYRHRTGNSEWKDEDYPVWFDWTACAFGGQRPWFRCPARGCQRRVAILYGGGIFACRHCYRLAYSSQREAGYGRARQRADRIRAKLGWEPGIANPNGMKPKGMHWRTFERLSAKHDVLTIQALQGMAVRLGFKW